MAFSADTWYNSRETAIQRVDKPILSYKLFNDYIISGVKWMSCVGVFGAAVV